MCLFLLGCSDDSSINEDLKEGYASSNLINKTLVLQNGNTKILSATHTSETTLKLNSSSADYSNPPSYEYTVESANKALYYIDFHLKTYSGYYHDYIYYNCIYDIELEYTSPNSGTFSGTQMKDAKISEISGTFILRIAGDEEEKEDEEDSPSEFNIFISKCSLNEITSNSAQVMGTVEVEGSVEISERGFIYGNQEKLTVENSVKIQSAKTLNTPVHETIMNLNSNTRYYVRQYVVCNSKTIYGEVSDFLTKKKESESEDNTDYSIEPIIQFVYPNKAQIAGKYTYYVTGGKFKKVGYCLSTSPHPTVTDKTIAAYILNNEPFGRVIENLEEGTTYYVRPFYQEGNKIIYCKESSFQTVGKDIQLTAEPSPKRDKIVVTYSVVPKGTYHLTLIYRTNLNSHVDPDLGYINEGNGVKEVDVRLIWGNIIGYNAYLEDISTGIRYVSAYRNGGY